MYPVLGAIPEYDGEVHGVGLDRQGSSLSTMPPPPIFARVALMITLSGGVLA